MQQQFLEATLAIHVAAGVLALLAGAVAIATTKGGRRHRRAGRAYVLTMAVVVATALPLAAADGNYFLFSVAVFSGYLVLNGYRVLARRRSAPGEAAPIDWAGHLTMAVAGVAMVGLGARMLIAGDGLGAALVTFGGIGLTLAAREVAAVVREPPGRGEWVARHIAFMGGGYIATVTAAVTVNLASLPPLVRWVGPTAVGTPAILLAVVRYRRRFEDRVRGSPAG